MSKKLPGIRVVPVELEIGGQATAKGTKPLQQLFASGFACNAELPGVRDMDFDLIALLEFKRFDHGSRKPARETVSPFCDLHAGPLSWIYAAIHVYPRVVEVKMGRGGQRSSDDLIQVRAPVGAGARLDKA